VPGQSTRLQSELRATRRKITAVLMLVQLYLYLSVLTYLRNINFRQMTNPKLTTTNMYVYGRGITTTII
jgi:hypothetical protein